MKILITAVDSTIRMSTDQAVRPALIPRHEPCAVKTHPRPPHARPAPPAAPALARASPRRSRRRCSRSAWPSARRSGPRRAASLAGERIPLLLPRDRRDSRTARRQHDEHEHDGRAAAVGHAPGRRRPRPSPTRGERRAPLRHWAPRRRRRAPRRHRPQRPSAAKTPTTTTRRSAASEGHAPARDERMADQLSGATFAQALAQPAAAPYIDSQLVPAGTLLERLVLAAGAARSRARPGCSQANAPQTLDSIVQPPCPEGAAGAPCAPETAGALTAADEFLKAGAARDHRERRLPGTRPRRDHVRHGRQRRPRRACPPAPRPRRSAPSRQWACCCSRRSPAPARGPRAPSTQLHPSRACRASALTTHIAVPTSAVHRNQPRRPTLHALEPAHRKATWWLVALVG